MVARERGLFNRCETSEEPLSGRFRNGDDGGMGDPGFRGDRIELVLQASSRSDGDEFRTLPPYLRRPRFYGAGAWCTSAAG